MIGMNHLMVCIYFMFFVYILPKLLITYIIEIIFIFQNILNIR